MRILQHSFLPPAVFLTALASTLFCTAVNCYTWRLAYPLWRKVRAEEFGALHREYLRQLTPIITLPHILMFFSSAALLSVRPLFLPFGSAALIFAFNAAVILISIFAAGPIHDRFSRQERLDGPGLRRLVQISALRSLLMLASSLLLCGSLWSLLGPQ